MFQVKHNECVGFESRWTVKKVYAVGSTQASGYAKTDMECNTSEKRHIEVQTESDPVPQSCDVDEEKLAAWLKRIYPQVKKELDDCANSKAFKGYKLSSDKAEANCKLIQSVNVVKNLKDADNIGSHVSALSWNSTNQTLAVACTFKHNSWCYHDGFIGIYSLDRDDNLPETPRIKLTAESCVTAIKFHTVFPAIIAGGLFSGLIIIWSIQKDEQEILAKIDAHGERITQLQWITDINSPKNVLLVSSSLDGYLILWNFNLMGSSLTPKERHQIRPPRFPKAEDETSTDGDKLTRAITSFDFSKHNPEIFIVGAEGGMIIQCSILGAAKLPSSTADAPVLDSAVMYYNKLQGEVTAVSFSPNRKDMFMTCSTSAEIRIYMIGQEEPARVLFSKNALYSVSWVPYEEKLICGGGQTGYIEIFHIIENKSYKNTSREIIKTQMLTQIEINKTKPNIVATATEEGHIQMWRVPWAAFSNQSA